MHYRHIEDVHVVISSNALYTGNHIESNMLTLFHISCKITSSIFTILHQYTVFYVPVACSDITLAKRIKTKAGLREMKSRAQENMTEYFEQKENIFMTEFVEDK